MNLSPHFTLQELTRTSHRDFITQNYDLGSREPIRSRLERVCRELLEPVRAAMGARPVRVTSGYRSPRLNRRVGGSRRSQHMRGEAADFQIPGVDLRAIYDWIKQSDLAYGQLILECYDPRRGTGWIHLSLGTRRQNLIAERSGRGGFRYRKG